MTAVTVGTDEIPPVSPVESDAGSDPVAVLSRFPRRKISGDSGREISCNRRNDVNRKRG